jgi:hypothetical protein
MTRLSCVLRTPRLALLILNGQEEVMKASTSSVALSSHGLYEQESIFETVTPGAVDQEPMRLLDHPLKI